jgi:uncharacterized surface protein with fasciclin (FAS1) repeats
MRSTLRTRTALAGVLVAAALGTAACGSSSTTAGASGSPAAAVTSPSTSPSMSDASAPFGPGCASVPSTGSGSFAGMAADPVATAASNNPALSTLVTAVKAAGLVDTLNSAQGITVFAPADSAFAAMDQATLKKALADPKGLLTTVLTYHVVSGKLTPAMLAGTHKTLQGGTVTVTGSGTDFTVNGSAKVVCGNVQTANATVYIIDGVLIPKM